MHFCKATSLVTLAAVIQAQSINQLVSQIPTCALSCLTTAIEASGCSLSDYVCQCTTGRSAISTKSSGCLLTACSAADVSTTVDITNRVCIIAASSGSTSAAVSAASSVAASVVFSKFTSPTIGISSTITPSEPSSATTPTSPSTTPPTTLSTALSSTPPTAPSSPSSVSPAAASTAPSSSSSAAASPSASPTPSADHTAAIAGSVVGGVVGLAAIAAIAIYYILRLRTQRAAGAAPQLNLEPTAAVEKDPVMKQELPASVPMELDGKEVSARF